MQLGRVGIFSSGLRRCEHDEAHQAAAELEALGYTSIWLPGGIGGDVLEASSRLLDATQRCVVATGILNIWMHDAGEVARAHGVLEASHPGRFLLGLGASHAPLVEASGQTFDRPLAKLRDYLDRLDAAHPPVPVGERVIGALGPRMLELARERSAGAHPYHVTPEATEATRTLLGAGPILAPEQPVVLDTGASEARSIARAHLATYLGLPNYTRNFLRMGFTEEDFAGGGSDRLVDGLVAWGSPDAIAAPVGAHLAAGADHVAVQVLTADPATVARDAWRSLAPYLVDGAG